MRSQRDTAALYFSRRGAEALLGHTVEQLDETMLEDTSGVADGQPQYFFDSNDGDITLRIFRQGAWYAVTLAEEV